MTWLDVFMPQQAKSSIKKFTSKSTRTLWEKGDVKRTLKLNVCCWILMQASQTTQHASEVGPVNDTLHVTASRDHWWLKQSHRYGNKASGIASEKTDQKAHMTSNCHRRQHKNSKNTSQTHKDHCKIKHKQAVNHLGRVVVITKNKESGLFLGRPI